jgi:hypothetical protein
MAGEMDSGDKPVDPDTERELQATMNEAVDTMRDEGIAQLARYMKSNYQAFRKEGFSRKNAFTFTILLYQSLLAHG